MNTKKQDENSTATLAEITCTQVSEGTKFYTFVPGNHSPLLTIQIVYKECTDSTPTVYRQCTDSVKQCRVHTKSVQPVYAHSDMLYDVPGASDIRLVHKSALGCCQGNRRLQYPRLLDQLGLDEVNARGTGHTFDLKPIYTREQMTPQVTANVLLESFFSNSQSYSNAVHITNHKQILLEFAAHSFKVIIFSTQTQTRVHLNF